MIPKAVIHLDNLRHNLDEIKASLPANQAICLPVKANAYGHGMVEVARAALAWGVNTLAVAGSEESFDLRKAGITLPILMMTPPVPGEIPELVSERIEPFVGSLEMADLLNKEGVRQNRKVRVHLKVDTGMGRNGCLPGEALKVARFIAGADQLELAGLCTHFPGADMADNSFSLAQGTLFADILKSMRAEGIDPDFVHAANSGAIVGGEAFFNMVRPGIISYGYYPSDEQNRKLDLKPVMSLETQVVHLKTVPAGTPISYGMTYHTSDRTRIATLRIGYGDGYFRNLSGKSRVLIGGKSYPLVGRVCMDHVMADLGLEGGVMLYDRAILFGPDEQAPDAEELATLAGTISYEILTSVGSRVIREFVGSKV